MRSLAKRWQLLDTEVKDHDRILDQLTQRVSPALRDGFGIGQNTAAELLTFMGNNRYRMPSEACFAKLCCVVPIPASSGMTNLHGLAWNGHRQANAAYYGATILGMQCHELTKAYVVRRTEEGLSKRDIIRCPKRLIAREAFGRIMTDFRARTGVQNAHIPILDLKGCQFSR